MTVNPSPHKKATMNSLQTLSLAALCIWGAAGTGHAADTTAAQQLAHWNAQAGSPGQADKGKAFFAARHGGE